MKGDIWDLLQAASNIASGSATGNVDAAAWVLRKAGLPIPPNALGTSKWAEEIGLTRPVREGLPKMAGESLGLLSPIVASARAPQIAAGLLTAGDNLAAPVAAGMGRGQRGHVGIAAPEEARIARMVEQGYTPGFWRGGKTVADGPHYTPDMAAAVSFGKRSAGDAADVREYAIRLGNSLDFSKRYTAGQLRSLRDVLKKDYGSKYADELLDVPSDYGGAAPGAAIYQIAEQLSGGNAAAALRAAGFDTINAGQEVVTLHRAGLIRDAKRALFDPKNRLSADPFAAVGAGAIGLGLLDQLADDK